jgi:transcriptional antiterminator
MGKTFGSANRFTKKTLIPLLTTRERDILNLLLRETNPITTSVIAERLQISPRKVRYSLKGVQNWLTNQGDCELISTRNVGVQLVGSTVFVEELGENLLSNSTYRLILDSAQRQQWPAPFFWTTHKVSLSG